MLIRPRYRYLEYRQVLLWQHKCTWFILLILWVLALSPEVKFRKKIQFRYLNAYEYILLVFSIQRMKEINDYLFLPSYEEWLLELFRFANGCIKCLWVVLDWFVNYICTVKVFKTFEVCFSQKPSTPLTVCSEILAFGLFFWTAYFLVPGR